MINMPTGKKRKLASVGVQLALLAALGLWLSWIFSNKGGPPEFARDQWTQRDGFMAISYGSLTREPREGLNSRSQFAEHLKALKDAGYNFITTDDIIDFYVNDKPLPEKAIYMILEGGRKDNAIFGQEELAAARAHATFFTHTRTLSNWSNFFVTYANVLSISQSSNLDLGSQGYELARINEHISGDSPEASSNFFLCDFLRDEKGGVVESNEEMFARLEQFYKKSFEPLDNASDYPPKAYIFMPANAFAAFMPAAVEEANQELMRRHFRAAFTREGPAFNSRLDSLYGLSRMRVKAEWSAEKLLESLKLWRAERDAFAVTGAESAEDWVAHTSRVEVDGRDLVVFPAEGFIDPAMLRGSNLWDNMRLSVTFTERDAGERHIYLRYSSKDSYLRLTLRSNRLFVHERVPGVGLVNIFDEVLPVREPWKFDILLRGDRLKITLNGTSMDPELLPLAASTSRGSVGLGASAHLDYTARFGGLTAVSLPTLWQNARPAANGDGGELKSVLTPQSRGESSIGGFLGDNDNITAMILPLPGPHEDGSSTLGALLRACAGGRRAIAALPEGDLNFSLERLAVPPLTESRAVKLWFGVLARPNIGADWDRVGQTMGAIRERGFKAVLRLSAETAVELANSGKIVKADFFVLDFARHSLPEQIWTALANKHNRNNFLYLVSNGAVEFELYSPHTAE